MTDTHPESRQPAPRHWELVPFPCHHGCTCNLHEQTVYGSMVEPHDPDRLDNGEMAALVQAGDNVTRLLNGYRDYFEDLTARVSRAHVKARSAITLLERFHEGRHLRETEEQIRAVERDFAHYSQAEREPAPGYLKFLTYVVLAIVVVFDAWYFHEVFAELLQAGAHDWTRLLGALVGGVLGAGLFVSGRLLSEPLRRLRSGWRRRREREERLQRELEAREPPGTDEPANRRTGSGQRSGVAWWRLGRWVMILLFPVTVVGVFAYWALIRADQETGGGTSAQPWEVALLLLVLALTLMTLEIVTHNPYQEKRRSAVKRHEQTERRETRLDDAADNALGELDRLWRSLRSCRDQGLTLARAELGRAWSTLILPARFRHGRAGWEPPDVAWFGSAESFPHGGERTGHPPHAQPPDPTELTARDVERLYQFFENIRQPIPGLGPLAEVVRSVRELDPEPLRRRKDAIRGEPRARSTAGGAEGMEDTEEWT